VEAGDSRPGLNALAVWVDGRYLGDCYKQSPNKIECTGCIGKGLQGGYHRCLCLSCSLLLGKTACSLRCKYEELTKFVWVHDVIVLVGGCKVEGE